MCQWSKKEIYSHFIQQPVWSSLSWSLGNIQALWKSAIAHRLHGVKVPRCRSRWGWLQSSLHTRMLRRPAWRSLNHEYLDLCQWWWISSRCEELKSLLMEKRRKQWLIMSSNFQESPDSPLKLKFVNLYPDSHQNFDLFVSFAHLHPRKSLFEICPVVFLQMGWNHKLSG